jgi:hypothetical protein
MQQIRTGFYPVCARDYVEPLRLLKGWIDELIFCDIMCMPKSSAALDELRHLAKEEKLPNPSILTGDALVAMRVLKPVDLFFMRRDSDGEGGSELNLLGTGRLPDVVEMIQPAGLLVTDRACGRGWFDDFEKGRRNPYRVKNREIHLSIEQPWREHGLLSFVVR